MAELKTSTVRVGILIAVSLGLLGFAILSFGVGTRLFSGSEVLSAHFQRINGLQVGAPVRLAGVTIGSVESIRFPSDARASYVVVSFWISESAAQRVHTDSAAKIASLGVLGDKFLVLTSGSTRTPPAEPGSVLASVEPFDYATLFERADTTDVLANILRISDSLRSLTDAISNGHGLAHELFYGPPPDSEQKVFTLESLRGAVDTMAHTAADLDRLVQEINRGKGVIGALVNQRGGGPQLVANMQASSESLRQASQRINQLVARYQQANGTIPQLMENQAYARDVMGNLSRSSSDLEQILHKVNTGQGTLGKLVNDPRLYDSTQKLVATRGWGIAVVKGVYGIFHPFSNTTPAASVPQTSEEPATLSPDAMEVPVAAAPAPTAPTDTGAPPANHRRHNEPENPGTGK
jgi:phospholipid/cholesterol/gamma-HCH transport system substrate-binding protein